MDGKGWRCNDHLRLIRSETKQSQLYEKQLKALHDIYEPVEAVEGHVIIGRLRARVSACHMVSGRFDHARHD